MMKWRSRWTSVLVAASVVGGTAAAQGTGPTITGTVHTEAGAALPAVSVSIPSLGVGAYTDAAGKYRFTVPAARATGRVTLMARRVGYQPRTVTVDLAGASTITQDFALANAPTQLSGVVVTALGIQKRKSELGTAVQQVSSEELTRTPAMNVVSDLSGKVSGVNIQGSGVQGGSTSIVIRGQNSITGNNQPLFIVDGVPLYDFNRGGSPGGGSLIPGRTPPQDFGSSISDIDPDNIASVSVLKGPNAAALYGSRAANGVIIITTKQGEATAGKVNTSITASYLFDTPSILPNYQNVYGQGAGGEFAFVNGAGAGTADDLDQSFGPKMDGRLIPQFTSPVGPKGSLVPTPFLPHPDNVRSFFNTGGTFDGNVAFSGGTDRANARLSVGTQRVKGLVPSSAWQKFSGTLVGTFRVSSRLTTSASLQYLRDQAQDRPGVGYTNSILEQFIWFGRQVDLNALKTFAVQPNQLNAVPQWTCNQQYNWNCNFHNNPYWLQVMNPEHDSRDNLLGSVQGTYTLTPWLNAQLRSGSNVFRFNSENDVAGGNNQQGLIDPSYNGGFSFYSNYNNENNTQLLFTANKQATSAIALNGVLGGNVRKVSYNSNGQGTTGILAPGIYNVSNAAITPTITNYTERRQTNSVFGSASFTLDNWWTVEATARNDWSSTLPKANNSYFYPSFNTSLVLSDAIPALRHNAVVSYLKVRGSVADVGADAGAYQLQTVYNGSSNKFAGSPLFTYSDVKANPDLKPEITRAQEGGLELGLFNNRITADASWYRKATMNQVINLPVSASSGFSTVATNAGKIVNAGVDATLTVIPIETGPDGFRWTSTFNYSHNQSKVAALTPGVSTLVLGSQWGLQTQARVGFPYGEFFGYSYARDSLGNILTSGGIPDFGPLKVLGNIQPRWTGGWGNEFRYKHVTLSGLFDFHVGGDIFSISNMFGNYAGVFKESLRGREVDWNKPGLVVKGVDDVTGKPNTDTVTAENYWQNLFELHEAWMYKDTWVKLRELRLSIDLPTSWAGHLNASAVNVAFIGRNLWLVKSGVPNIDPEVNYSTGNSTQGFEFAPVPNPRSVGVNVRITP